MPDLKTIREKEFGLSQQKLGILLGGLGQGTVWLWEKGKTKPPPYLRYALAWLAKHGDELPEGFEDD